MLNKTPWGTQVIAELDKRPSWESNPRVIGRLMRPIHSATLHVISILRNSVIIAGPYQDLTWFSNV